MSDVTEFFTELLFGTGAWLGLLLILSIIFLVSLKDKMANYIFIPLTIFMGIMYLSNIAEDSNFMYASILMFTTTFILMIRVVKK